MNELALSQSISIENKQYKGVPVVSFRDIDALHRKPEGSAKRNFNQNKERFIEGVDFFVVQEGVRNPYTPPVPRPEGLYPNRLPDDREILHG